MVSTFTTNKGLEKPGNGDYVDTWNIPVNGDMDIIDQSLGGTTSLNATSGSATLTSSQYRSMAINVTGAMSANVTYTIPSGVGGSWIVFNNTTDATGGPWSLVFASAGGGTSITIRRGFNTTIYSDGTNIRLADNSVGAAGSPGQVQFNSAGNFAASANFVFDSANNRVGIGTSSPQATLDVNGGVAMGNSYIRGDGVTEGGQLDFYNFNNSSTGLTIDVAGLNVGRIMQSTATNSVLEIGQFGGSGGTIRFITEGSEKARFTATGRLGIGTTGPGYKLTLVAALNDGIAVTDGSTITGFMGPSGFGGLGFGTITNSNLSLFTNNTLRATITSGGNFGIGTSTPSERLGVSGNVSVTGTVTAGGAGTFGSLSTSGTVGGGAATFSSVTSGGTGAFNAVTSTTTISAGGAISGSTLSATTTVSANATANANPDSSQGFVFSETGGSAPDNRRLAISLLPGTSGTNREVIFRGINSKFTYSANSHYFFGYVGIGVTTPTQPLQVSGIIESTSGGYKFPDGTTQTTAGTFIPTGVIVMWSGSIASIPAGWALCNGSSGTPDLRDRFIVGAGSSYGVGATGGANSITLSASEIPAHTHTFSGNTGAMSANNIHSHSYSDPGHAHTYYAGSAGVGGSPYSSSFSYSSNGAFATSVNGVGITINAVDLNHSHAYSGTTSSVGGSGAHENRPPYYALAYIMKL